MHNWEYGAGVGQLFTMLTKTLTSHGEDQGSLGSSFPCLQLPGAAAPPRKQDWLRRGY